LVNLTGYILKGVSVEQENKEMRVLLECLREFQKNNYSKPRFKEVHDFLIEILRTIHCTLSRFDYFESNVRNVEDVLRIQLENEYLSKFCSLCDNSKIVEHLRSEEILSTSLNSKKVILELLIRKMLKIVVYRELKSIGSIAPKGVKSFRVDNSHYLHSKTEN